MSSETGGGKAGAAGDVRGKSVEERMEILERQENMLRNKKFISRLPDRGKRILDYTEKVRAAIAEKKGLKKTTDLLSKFRQEFTEKQNEIKEKNHIAWSVDKKTLPAETLQNKSSNSTGTNTKPDTEAVATSSEADCRTKINTEKPSLPVKDTVNPSLSKDTLHEKDKSHVDTTDSSFTADIVSQMSHNTDVDAALAPVQEPKTLKTTKNNAGTTDDLADSFKTISIHDITAKGVDTSSTSNQSNNPSHSLKQSHFLEVIDKRARSPVNKKEKFRTNRLPSDSNSSSPYQSPGEKALRLTSEERKAQDRKHLDDITAARLPPLNHSPALLLPLDESLSLQIHQKKAYDEKQAKLAAQKLYEKLNIKMAPFNPEGDSYMKYRDQRDEEGYDAEE